ncbi:MAG TPA: protein kinase [Gemmatimonadales bacterium]
MTDATRPTTVSEWRHELRTPVNHIMGYAEMLLEDAVDSGAETQAAALRDAVTAARDAVTLINTTLPPERTDITDAELLTLADSLQDPRDRVAQAMERLVAGGATGAGASFHDDVRRILRAADRLLQVARSVAPAPVEPQVADATPGDAPPGAARILIVDDIEENRDVLRRRLEREGHAVVSAENGRQALDLLAAGSCCDLVLLDVMMPEIDGFEVLRRLKGDTSTRDIPVIMISALDDVEGIGRCIEAGAEDYLPKPFDPILLRARITASLEKKRLRDQEKEYLHQVNRVIAAATAVETGAYEGGALAEVARREDALGRLARVFDGMAAQVKAREDRLRTQVRDLQREIKAARDTAEHATPHGLDDGKLAVGDLLANRYQIEAVIGAGGMGTVYRARDTELDEVVAIKTLRPEFVSDDKLVERFKSEIRLARRISHQNVVRTHDLGEWKGLYYLTMELVEGLTVRELLDQRGRLEISSTIAIGRQLAASLAVAHEQSVIHRDIKPQNLLLDASGVLKVMDFGVARLAERSVNLTEAGLILGTPAYMSPEQIIGEEIDGRTDLYAAGVVLYECLTGRLPFDGHSVVSLIAKVLNDEAPPPLEANADIPPALSGLVQGLLAKDPADRPQSAAELATQLDRLG